MLSEALRLIRVFHDMKQFEAAEKLGISKSYLSEIESGSKSPTMDLIEKYSSVFGLPASSILFFSEELPNAKGGAKIKGAIASRVLDLLRLVERRSGSDAA